MSDSTQPPATPSPLSDADKDVIRRGAFGAIALVSKADPGFFATFKESMAGSKALAKAPEQIRELLQGGLITPPTGSPEQVESSILGDLKSAMTALAPHPELQRGYREVLDTAINEVAAASKGVSSDEQAEIDRIRGVLDGGAGA